MILDVTASIYIFFSSKSKKEPNLCDKDSCICFKNDIPCHYYTCDCLSTKHTHCSSTVPPILLDENGIKRHLHKIISDYKTIDKEKNRNS